MSERHRIDKYDRPVESSGEIESTNPHPPVRDGAVIREVPSFKEMQTMVRAQDESRRMEAQGVGAHGVEIHDQTFLDATIEEARGRAKDIALPTNRPGDTPREIPAVAPKPNRTWWKKLLGRD